MLQNLLSVSIAARISAKPESKIKIYGKTYNSDNHERDWGEQQTTEMMTV